MNNLYLLKSFLYTLFNIFIILLLGMSVFDLLDRTIVPFFGLSIFLVLVFWLLSIHSFYKFTSLLNDEKIARETDQLQLEESLKLIQTLRSQRHDFRNQLQVIKVMAQFNKHNEIVDYIQECHTALDFSNNIHILIENAALSAMVIFFTTQAREKGINFRVDSNINFTDFRVPLVKITRVLGNIIQNAIEIFQPTYLGDRLITLTMLEMDDNYNFIIWNNGPPIPHEKQTIIFQPGFTTKDSTGLGLFIVKQLVEEMNGEISLKSFLEEGTKFTITIPKKLLQSHFSVIEKNPLKKT